MHDLASQPRNITLSMSAGLWFSTVEVGRCHGVRPISLVVLSSSDLMVYIRTRASGCELRRKREYDGLHSLS